MLIKKIKISKDKVEVEMDKKTILISIETYFNGRFLVGEEIDEDELKLVEQQEKINKIKIELLKKLSNKRLSSLECYQFLLTNDISKEQSEKIINEYEKNYLINDEELAELIFNQCMVNRKGLQIFKNKIAQRGVKINYQEFIDENFDEEKYLINIKKVIEKYKNKGKNKSINALKQYIHNKLIENGYVDEEFSEYINLKNVDESKNVNDEIKKFFKNREINSQNIAKITKKLLSKGFNYDIIKQSIRECEKNETY